MNNRFLTWALLVSFISLQVIRKTYPEILYSGKSAYFVAFSLAGALAFGFVLILNMRAENLLERYLPIVAFFVIFTVPLSHLSFAISNFKELVSLKEKPLAQQKIAHSALFNEDIKFVNAAHKYFTGFTEFKAAIRMKKVL